MISQHVALLTVLCVFQRTDQQLQTDAKISVQHNFRYAEKIMEHMVPGIEYDFKWDRQSCLRILNLMQKKSKAVNKIMNFINDLKVQEQNSTKKSINHSSVPTSQIQALTLRIFVEELNETELLIVHSLNWLEKVLGGDYSSLLSLTGNAWNRLEDLRQATLKVEQEYMSLVRAKQKMMKANHTHIKGIIDDILHEVSDAADNLEAVMDEHVFENAFHNFDSKIDAGNIETVLKLPYNNENEIPSDQLRKRSVENVRLIDPNENQFVLVKAKDATMPHEDPHLIQDLILMWLVATFLGWICYKINLPAMFGFVVSGIILGPAFLNVIQCIVQIESFGQLGMFFTLFTVGLEFSIKTIKKVMKVAVLGTSMVTILFIVLAILLGLPWEVSTSECVFVASCLSLSSPSLVVGFLFNSHSDVAESHSSDLHLDYSQILIGILVTQKIYMGLLMAFLPKMALHTKPDAYAYISVIGNFIILSGICILVQVLMKCLMRKQNLWPPLQKSNQELIVISTASFMFLLLLITKYLHMSMELGCFLAGIIFNIVDHHKAEEVFTIVQPIKHLLGCIFFASIGLHIYPQFFFVELVIILMLTIATIFTKYCVYMFTMCLLVRDTSAQIRFLVPAGLAQVSEFSFVLASRARKFDLISREVYLLILGVTLSSLLTAPIIWNISVKYAMNKRIIYHLQ